MVYWAWCEAHWWREVLLLHLDARGNMCSCVIDLRNELSKELVHIARDSHSLHTSCVLDVIQEELRFFFYAKSWFRLPQECWFVNLRAFARIDANLLIIFFREGPDTGNTLLILNGFDRLCKSSPYMMYNQLCCHSFFELFFMKGFRFIFGYRKTRTITLMLRIYYNNDPSFIFDL